MNLIQTKSFKLAIYKNGDENSSKLALILPGKLDTKDYPHMRSHVDYLASKGYFALSFDPPGTWESPGDIKLYTMTNYLKAINEIIEYFGNRPTFVMGHSRGGSMAMLAGITNPHITRFASVMSHYSFKPTTYGEYPNQEWKIKGFQISQRGFPNNPNRFKKFKLPYGFLEDQILYDMLDGLKQTEKPKLFILGKRDRIVNPEIVKTAYEAASQPKELQELDSDHDYRLHPNLISQVNDFVGNFLDTSFLNETEDVEGLK